MSKSNYSSQHSTSHSRHRSSRIERSPPRSYHQSSRSYCSLSHRSPSRPHRPSSRSEHSPSCSHRLTSRYRLPLSRLERSPPRSYRSPSKHSPSRLGHSPSRLGHSPSRLGHSPSRSGHQSHRLEYSPSRSYRSSSRHERSPSQRSPSRPRFQSSRSEYSSSHTHLQLSRSEHSTLPLQGSTSHVDKSHRLHSHDSIYSPDPSRAYGSQYSTTNDNEENDRFRQQYPPFEVPTSIYKVIFVNKNTSMEEMNLLVNHAQSCNQFTIDTESERSNGQLALIQMQTLPQRLPTFVILIELAHLPSEDSHMYVEIKKFFDLVFRLGNELYSWGDMEQELRPIKDYNLIRWPLLPSMIDIQPHYGGWYDQARILQESCCPKHHSYDANVVNDNPPKCECYEKNPYRQGQLWSLQKALIYSKHLFMDKSIRTNNWAGGLTNKGTKLSSSRRKNMVNYAVNDVLATTMLIRPILEEWSFEMVQKIKIDDLYVQFKSTPPPQLPQKTKKIKKNINTQKFISALFGNNDLEPISDDEIYCSQIIEPVKNTKTQDVEPIDDDYIPVNNNSLNDNELIVNNHYMVDDVNDKEKPAPTKKRTKNQQRSVQARHRKNHRRNTALKKKRYYYSIKRKWYPRFPMLIIRKILRLYNIDYKHVRDDGEELLIGLKDRRSRNTAQHQLPRNIFNRQSYFHYRKVFRR